MVHRGLRGFSNSTTICSTHFGYLSAVIYVHPLTNDLVANTGNYSFRSRLQSRVYDFDNYQGNTRYKKLGPV